MTTPPASCINGPQQEDPMLGVVRMGVFVDISNIYYCVGKRFGQMNPEGKWIGRKINYERYLAVATGQNQVYRAFAYGAQYGTEANRFLECLRAFGYIPRYKKPKEFDNPDYRINIEIFDQVFDVLKKQVEQTNMAEAIFAQTGDPMAHALESAGFKPQDLKQLKDSMDAIKKVLRGKKDIRKADWDVGLAMDVVRIANRLDQVVIGSADGDLAPLVEWAKEQGCRCIVYACNISRELRDVADEIIEIDDTVLESKQ